MTVEYDFPGRVSGVDAAQAELKRIGRSAARAAERGDHRAAAYLDRRYERCRRILDQLRFRSDPPAHHHIDWSAP